MSQAKLNKRLWAGTLMAGMALFVFTEPAWALFGRWAAAAVVVGATRSAEASSQQAVASANAQSAANAAAASAEQSAAAAQQAAARATAPPPAPAKTPQQKLQELQSLYDQKLISASDYEAGKKKILSQLTN